MSEWQPIETAPKDGTPVLLLVEEFRGFALAASVPWDRMSVIIGWCAVDAGRRSVWEGCFGEHHDSGCPTCGSWFEWPHVNPTHWMPLPAPPAS